MLQASLTLDPEFRVDDVQPRTFGSFVEHVGRCVYTGIFEPGHATADEDGLRRDVLDLVRELGVTLVRYPGGNFVSGYHWEDGIGPVEQRPARLDRAWHSLETNEFGIAEFARWADKAGIEMMCALNLGTRGAESAVDMLEYCNQAGGTRWSDLRISHGHPEPFGVRLWCLGNELDGPWQIGHKTAEEYGRLAAETARKMRMMDPGLELIACGSSHSAMPTFGSWEATVLEHAYDEVDYLSLHAYYEEHNGDTASFLASALDMEAFVESVIATTDHLRAKTRSRKRINLSFDEWNVWYISRFQNEGPPTDWPVAPRLLEDTYSIKDAVVVGTLLITLLRHSDRVTAACQAQLVNVIAPIRTEPGGPAWRQTTFYPFAHASLFATGEVLDPVISTPTYESSRHGDTPVIDAVATHDRDAGQLVVFAVNRHLEEEVGLTVWMRAFPGYRLIQHVLLADDDLDAANTRDRPDRVRPRIGPSRGMDGASFEVVLPPVSWNVLRMEPVEA